MEFYKVDHVPLAPNSFCYFSKVKDGCYPRLLSTSSFLNCDWLVSVFLGHVMVFLGFLGVIGLSKRVSVWFGFIISDSKQMFNPNSATLLNLFLSNPGSVSLSVSVLLPPFPPNIRMILLTLGDDDCVFEGG